MRPSGLTERTLLTRIVRLKLSLSCCNLLNFCVVGNLQLLSHRLGIRLCFSRADIVDQFSIKTRSSEQIYSSSYFLDQPAAMSIFWELPLLKV